MIMQTLRWHAFESAAALTAAAVAHIRATADAAIVARGAFHLVLAGGNTPRGIYATLATQAADWPRWHVWFGDERCLPADHPERNSRMATEAWLRHITIPPAQIHAIAAEAGASEAARRYAQALAGVGAFDLVLLGLGEDGHTASLFPGHDWGTDAAAPDVLPVFDAPKPPPARVTLSARRLSQARQVLFLVSGAGKRRALADWRAGLRLPAAAIAPENGVDVFHDLPVD